MKLEKIEQANSSIKVEISDPGDKKRYVIVITKERVVDRLRNGILVVREKGGEGQVMRKEEDSLTEAVLALSFAYNSVVQCLVYKQVAVKVYPVPGMMLLGIRIVRQFPEDLLEILLSISSYLPLFVLGTHLTKKRIESIGL